MTNVNVQTIHGFKTKGDLLFFVFMTAIDSFLLSKETKQALFYAQKWTKQEDYDLVMRSFIEKLSKDSLPVSNISKFLSDYERTDASFLPFFYKIFKLCNS